MIIYSHSLQGRRDDNEDTHYIFDNLNNNIKKINPITFLSVFDGHGGKQISHFLKNNLPLYFLKNNNNLYLKSNLAINFFNDIFNYIQKTIINQHPKIVQRCGSTACICIHYINKNNKPKLWVINLGDTRIIKCNKMNISEQLSLDHKPNEPSEKKRIESLCGKISKDLNDDYRIKNLSLSRSFGDLDCVPYVTHIPSIYAYNINKGDKFIILACDGLWDVLSNQDAADFINALLDNPNYKGNYAKDLAEHAFNSKSYDNITVIVYIL